MNCKKIVNAASLLLFFVASVAAQKSFVVSKDIFANRAFIENKGQFDHRLLNGKDIRYAYTNSEEHFYFTQTGVTYKQVENYPLTREQAEDMERGKKTFVKPDKISLVNMTWLNSNKDIQISMENILSHYYTSGGPEMNAKGSKRIIYKNVYPNIDIEYSMPDDKATGVKYSIILHPGADPSVIQMAYSGDVKKMYISSGKIQVETSMRSITEHEISTTYENGSVINCNYSLNGNVISFNFPNGYDNTKTIVIDPWVTTLTAAFPLDDYAYESEYDYMGNLFAYGKWDKVAKYGPSGNLLWVFQGIVPGISWFNDMNSTANFVCNRSIGKIYMGEARKLPPLPGARILRLDAAGNYDNWVTPIYSNFKECWTMGYNCDNHNIYMLGGYSSVSSIVDQQNATMTPTSIIGSGDFQDNAIDDVGDIYTELTNNRIAKVNQGITGLIWQNSSFLGLNYGSTKSGHVPAGLYSQGFNCIAVNNNYLFGYNGFTLNVYSKANGALITSTTVPGGVYKQRSGIAADNCNNLYLGGDGSILCYNYNNGVFTSLTNIPLNAGTPIQRVYDMRLSKTNKLYIVGSGFAGVYDAIHSPPCSNTQFTTVTNCNGFNNGSAIVSLTTTIPNPSINYTLAGVGNTVTVLGTTLTSNTFTNLTNGIYTVQVTVNGYCGPAYTQTFALNCCTVFNSNQLIAQSNCTNAINGVTITPTGTIVPVAVVWSPTPGVISGNSLTVNSLTPGVTTCTINYGAGCSTTMSFNMLPAPPPLSFSLVNLTGSQSVTCLTPTINLAAQTNYTFGSVSYTWSSLSFTSNSQTITTTQANTFVVTGIDYGTGCTYTQAITVGMNTVAPTNSVNPPSQAITCISGILTFTGSASSPTINLQHDWYSPLNPLPGGVPIATSQNSISLLSGSISPGTYTLVTTNLTNGCKTMKTVTVTSLDAWPNFSLSSTTNYSVGCAPLNQTTISIINPVSTQTPPATCSYTFLPPSFGGVVTPSVILSGNTSTVTSIPGTWTVIVQDNSNWCRTILSVPIIQNTVAPNVSLSVFTNTLTCKNPTVLGVGTTTTPHTYITWNVPSVPPSLSTSTVVIGDPANGPNTSTNSLTYANFTVVATNSLNGCQSTSVITVYQNFKPPISNPLISVATPTAIYCTVANAPVVLTTGNSTTTSGGGPSAFVANPCWEGPSPQTPTCGPSSYSCYVPGVYTLTVEDNYNGCKSSGTVNVLDRTQPPVITNPIDNAVIDCGGDQATLRFILTGTMTGGVRYLITDYPSGAAFSPTNATSQNVNPFLGGTNSSSVNVSLPGMYHYVVTNTLTGCQAYGEFNVIEGGLTATFTPDPATGYAPLNVIFTNQTSSSSTNTGISSIWSYGNGLSEKTNLMTTSTTFTAPGTYTVLLIATKGTCIDSTYKVIRVDIPSKMEVPNIFTPNGDGSNDVFLLHVANMGEINAIIHDRWGNKVYETVSKTGNIAWDGKNFNGKECAAGVYFYIITGMGNDSKEYKTKGNVTLIR